MTDYPRPGDEMSREMGEKLGKYVAALSHNAGAAEADGLPADWVLASHMLFISYQVGSLSRNLVDAMADVEKIAAFIRENAGRAFADTHGMAAAGQA